MPLAGWQLDMGAQLVSAGVHFRVWAPKAQTVEVEVQQPYASRFFPLRSEGDGIHSAMIQDLTAGACYRFRLDGEHSYPDPYSRAQPEGVHSWSEVVDPAFFWQDINWKGLRQDALIIYELHVGTYTPEGTFDGVVAQLDELKRLGITAIELMPIAEFPGDRNWGYDGVYLYAPTLSYGGCLGLKRLVDAAHQRGLAVLLDVVYNHLGPAGNYLWAYSDDYFTNRYDTPWGAAMNFDGPGSRWVRHFVVQNACYWLNEYHIDGLRLDSTHAIFDSSPISVLQELSDAARASVAPHRTVLIIAENENNDNRLVRSKSDGGYGLNGVWADDFHHAVRTFLTHEDDGYFADYGGRLEEVAFILKNGWLYQGEPSKHWGRPRGTDSGDLPAEKFVICIQDHDQIGNRALGERLNHQVSRLSYAVASALLLLAPETPLLFMGQEFAASSPFLYFTNHEPGLGKLVTQGRRDEFKKFRAFSYPYMRELIPDPQAEETFFRSKLNLSERQSNAGIYQFYKDLLVLRRVDSLFSVPDRQRFEAYTLSPSTLMFRRWSEDGQQRLVLFNFSGVLTIDLDASIIGGIAPDRWQIIFASDKPDYGFNDKVPILEAKTNVLSVILPGPAVVVLAGN